MVDHAAQPKPNAAQGQSRDEDAPAADKGERVAKALARAGVASRREVERLIGDGRVALNGTVLVTPAVRVRRSDILTVDGAVVSEAEPTRLWRYHKPIGLVTTHSDPKGRPTVFERLPAGLPRVISVGRLDLSSEGLLLLTNDGGLARALERPETGLTRRYRARAFGRTDQAALDALADGVTVDGIVYGPILASLDKVRRASSASLKDAANLWITLTLSEGKNREVRRVLESLGLKVNRLIRLSYGPFALGVLSPGAAEEVGPRVIRELLSEHIAPQNLPRGERLGAVLAASSAPPSRRRARRPADASGAASEGGAVGTGAAKAVSRPLKTEYKPGWAKPRKRSPRGPAPPVKARSRGREALHGDAASRPETGASAKSGARAKAVSAGAGGRRGDDAAASPAPHPSASATPKPRGRKGAGGSKPPGSRERSAAPPGRGPSGPRPRRG